MEKTFRWIRFFFLYVLPGGLLLAFEKLSDRFLGRPFGLNVFCSILGFIVIGWLLLLPITALLKKILGPASDDLATDRRVTIWKELSQLYGFEKVSEDDVRAIARTLAGLEVPQKDLKAILETEVGPVCMPALLMAGDDYYDGIDDWKKDWLKQKILEGTKAYKFVRAIPLFGYLFALTVTFSMRRNVWLLLSEINLMEEVR